MPAAHIVSGMYKNARVINDTLVLASEPETYQQNLVFYNLITGGGQVQQLPAAIVGGFTAQLNDGRVVIVGGSEATSPQSTITLVSLFETLKFSISSVHKDPVQWSVASGSATIYDNGLLVPKMSGNLTINATDPDKKEGLAKGKVQ